MTKYKYYFKQPKTTIAKDILTWLAVGGAVYIAASSPYFITNVIRKFRRGNKYDRKDIYNAFYKLRKDGSIKISNEGRQIYIELTEHGRRKAGRFQINHLKIKKPKKWDKKWRIIIFDIPQSFVIKREALRGFLKRLQFYQLQKSVWINPYDCKDEIGLLKDFFGLNSKEIRFIVSDNIGSDTQLRKYFNL